MSHQSPGSATNTDNSHDVIVVGGGQAGLAIGYFLASQGRKFIIFEAGETPGAIWSERWDSLKLFTSVAYDSLPGLPFPGARDSYPGRDDVAAYLAEYARQFELPVELNSRVKALRRVDDRFQLEVDGRTYAAERVMIATGPFQAPFVPPIADKVDADVVQLHSAAYRSPEGIPEGSVLVVGGGNTGFQIAEELSRSHEVHLSIGSRQTSLPQRILGRDLFWYLEATGLIRKSLDTRIGRRLSGRETLIGSSPRRLRRRHGVHLHKRAVDASGRTVSFADGERIEVGMVIWATGFRPDYSWIHIPVFDQSGRVVHERGVTKVQGLYFLGLSWQHTRGSALLGWVGEDAKYIAERIEKFRAAASPSGTRGPVQLRRG